MKMYIDLTPGTPGIYARRCATSTSQAIRHGDLMWGNDLGIENYGRIRPLASERWWYPQRIEDDYRSGRVTAWLPDDGHPGLPSKAWYDFVGEPLPQDDV